MRNILAAAAVVLMTIIMSVWLSVTIQIKKMIELPPGISCGSVENHVYEHLLDTTVQIKAYRPEFKEIGPDTPFYTGTGWLTHGKDGTTFVWTAGHVVIGAFDSATKQWGKLRILSKVIIDGNDTGADISHDVDLLRISYCPEDSVEDLALLTLQEKRFKKPSVFLPDEKEYPKLGEPLILAGCTGGPRRGVFISQGTLGRRGIKIGNYQFDNSNMPAMPGCSGGPITDRRGRVIGAIMAGRSECHGYFTPSRRIRAWVEKMNVQYALYSNIPEPKTLDRREEILIPPPKPKPKIINNVPLVK